MTHDDTNEDTVTDVVCPMCAKPAERLMNEFGYKGCGFCYETDLAERQLRAAEKAVKDSIALRRTSRTASPEVAAYQQAAYETHLHTLESDIERITERRQQVLDISLRRDKRELELHRLQFKAANLRVCLQRDFDRRDLAKAHGIEVDVDRSIRDFQKALEVAEANLQAEVIADN